MADIDLPSMKQRNLSQGPLDRDRMVSVLWSMPIALRFVRLQSQRRGAATIVIGSMMAPQVSRLCRSRLMHIPALLVIR
jgi:hypothetical protein